MRMGWKNRYQAIIGRDFPFCFELIYGHSCSHPPDVMIFPAVFHTFFEGDHISSVGPAFPVSLIHKAFDRFFPPRQPWPWLLLPFHCLATRSLSKAFVALLRSHPARRPAPVQRILLVFSPFGDHLQVCDFPPRAPSSLSHKLRPCLCSS